MSCPVSIGSNRSRLLLLMLVILACVTNAISQTKNIPLNTYYKDQMMLHSAGRVLPASYPLNERDIPIHSLIRDSTKMYTDFNNWFFKKHWIEAKNSDGQINISPLVHFAGGASKERFGQYEENRTIYRNTRGIYAEGSFLNQFSFNLIIAENQTQFTRYESQIFKSYGEYYVYEAANDLGYTTVQQNAVVPGAARTKPFKDNAFDYAFAYGSFRYQINQQMSLDAGNSPLFIGSGYRSLFLSDYSVGAPYLRFKHAFSSRWSYQILYRNNKNLFRKPGTDYVEAPYENKLFSASSITFTPRENFSVSLFTSHQDVRNDFQTKNSLQWTSIVPIPLYSRQGVTGLNMDFASGSFKYYAQFFFRKYENYRLAFQVGSYWIKPFQIENLLIQLELNHIPDQFYAADNVKNSFTHYNLPLAHPRGQNFSELLARISYSKGLFFANSKTILYYIPMRAHDPGLNDEVVHEMVNTSLLPVGLTPESTISGKTIVQDLELGLRINRKYNLELYTGLRLRQSENFDSKGESYHNFAAYISGGLRVGLFNQYSDL